MTQNSKRTIEQINAEIEAVKNELKNVHGTETEVYARIVGYYRAVRNWNKGKRDEFNNRKLFTVDEDIIDSKVSNSTLIAKTAEKVLSTVSKNNSKPADLSHYDFFMRKTCPNCPPVKSFMEEVDFKGNVIDVDTDEGLREAAAKGVFSAPTVIFYDKDGNETGRGHTVEEIKNVMNPVAVVA